MAEKADPPVNSARVVKDENKARDAQRKATSSSAGLSASGASSSQHTSSTEVSPSINDQPDED